MTSGRPDMVAGTVMLAVVAAAMGGQSVVSLRMHAFTTYFTGALTSAVQHLVARTPEQRLAGVR